MVDAEFSYSYEYQGNAPKLVHTDHGDKQETWKSEFVPGTFPMAMPKKNQWLAQVCSLYVCGSVTETIAVTFKVETIPQMFSALQKKMGYTYLHY